MAIQYRPHQDDSSQRLLYGMGNVLSNLCKSNTSLGITMADGVGLFTINLEASLCLGHLVDLVLLKDES